jgi:hypothetical protein
VLVGLLVGVAVAVGELLAVGVGLEDGLDGVGDGWTGCVDGVAIEEGAAVGEGAAAVGTTADWLCTGATPAVGLAFGAAATITTPATIATIPPRTPAASNSRLQEGPSRVPGTGPSPVNGCLSRGLDWQGAASVPAAGSGRRPRKNIGARQTHP